MSSLQPSAASIPLSVLWVVAIDLAAWRLGSWVHDRIQPEARGLERVAFPLVFGLTMLGTGSFLLALGNLLYPWLLIALVLGLAALAVPPLVRGLRGARGLFAPGAGLEPLTVLAVALVLCYLPLCLIPGVPHDSLVYHLALPEEYLRHHGMVSFPYNLNANMPHTVELLFTPALAGGGIVAATLLMYQFTLMVLVGLVDVANHLKLPKPLPGVLCLVYLASPVVRWHIPLTYIEPALACVTLFALALLLRWRVEGRRALLLGCCWLVGWVMACKYTTWYMCAGVPLGALAVLIGRRLGPRALLRELALPCAVLAAPVFPWLLRQWKETGDPLYPNLYRVLKIDTWSDALQLQTTRKFSIIHGLEGESRLLTFLQKPWHLVNEPHFYLLGDPYSPVLLLPFLIALFLPSSYRGPRKLVTLAAAVGYFGWALVPTPANEGRYLAAVVPLLALAGALALEPLFRRRALAALAVVTVGAGLFYHFQLPKLAWDKRGPGPEFMAKNVFIEMAETLNTRLPPQAKVFFILDNRALGLERDRWVDTLYEAPASMELIRRHGTAAEAAAALRALGFTHILIDWQNARTYFDNPKVVVHPRINPRSSVEAQRRRLEELLDKECTFQFDLNMWKIYQLKPAAPASG